MTDRTGPGTGASPTGAGLARRRRRRWVQYSALGVAVVVLGAVGVGLVAYEKLSRNITADEEAAAELARYEKERPTALVRDAQNILLIGSETRGWGTGTRESGRDSGTERSDTTILLHLSANRSSATAVSLPRDLMVDVPSCRRRTAPVAGPCSRCSTPPSRWAVRRARSGPSRSSRTSVSTTTWSSASTGSRTWSTPWTAWRCLKEPIDDKAAELKLPAGKVMLDGEQALGYVRRPQEHGDGSDTDRMERQQRFLGALVNKVQSNDVLLNPARLYPMLDAATSSLTTDPDLASLRGLYDLVRGMRNIPTERVQFLTVPRTSYVYNANRDQLVKPAADKLFALLRADAPVAVAKDLPTDPASGHDSAFDYEEESRGNGKSTGKRPTLHIRADLSR